MLSEKTKKVRILYISLSVLVVLYLLSFVKSGNGRNKKFEIKTALINPSNIESVTEINIFNSKENVLLVKSGNFWTVKNKNSQLSLPVSSAKMKNMTNNLISIRSLYKLSDSYTQNNSFGLSDSDTVHLKYLYSQGFHELLFGNYDFSQKYRYLMTDKNTTVYEVNSALDSFLSTSINNWAELFLISQEVLGKIETTDIQTAVLYSDNIPLTINDIDKLLELRHGGLPEETNFNNPESKLIIEIGNKNKIEMQFYKTTDLSGYTVKADYYNYSVNSTQTFYTKITNWTYNKIKEITL